MPGTLVDSATADFFKFTGAKGAHIVVFGDAQSLTGSDDLQDPTVIDTVVTLYDANQNLLAGNDDAWPRNNSTDSVLLAQLSDDGDYFLKIEDCNSYKANNPASGIYCADSSGITTFDYEIFVGDLKETVGSATSPTTVAYEASSTAGYYSTLVIAGSFGAAGEKHAFTFQPPADLAVDPQARARTFFWVQPPGPVNGDGSTCNIKIWITDDQAGTNILGWADQVNYANGHDPVNGALLFSAPLEVDGAGALVVKPYYLWIQSDASTAKPATDSYFLLHSLGSLYYGQLEQEGVTGSGKNDTQASAETLDLLGSNTHAYFVDADLSSSTDVDWFAMDVPAQVQANDSSMVPPDHVALECQVEREGSGLRGFKATLYAADGTTQVTQLVETSPAVVDLTVGEMGDVAIPASLPGHKGYLKITATSQDTHDKATYYRCQPNFFTTK